MEATLVEEHVRKLSLQFALFFVVAAFAATAHAEILPLDKIEKGMKGYGLTVFDGSKVERFDVEILGVLKNIGPDQSLILANVDSEVIRRTGVMAGMSGSPIYIDGKVIGALAYSWQFAKEPVAGITPIEEMLAISTKAGSAAPAAGTRTSSMTLLNALVKGEYVAEFERLTAAVFGSRSALPASALPIATPLSLSRFAASTIERFSPMLENGGFIAVPAGGATAGSTSSEAVAAFAPGDAVGAVLIDGDFSVAATGTVTHVDGANVWGFGHPFLGMGEIEVPMAKAEVVAVMPSVARSFKFANAGTIVGTFQQDRAAGIFGKVGAQADMIPVEVVLNDARGSETFKLRVIKHPQLFPVMLAMAADSVVANAQRSAGERTIVLESTIDVEGFPPLELRDGWSGNQARAAIPAYLAVVANYLLSNEFTDTQINKITVRLRHDDAVKTAKLLEAAIETPLDGEVNPGDTVKLHALLKPYRGDEFRETFELKVPATAKPGPIHVLIGSGTLANQLGFTLVPPDPRNLGHVLQVVRRLRSSTDLTASMFTSSQGFVAGGAYLPNLPPSVAAVIGTDSSNSAQAPVRYDTNQQLARSLDYVVEGAVNLDLEVRPKI